jgi:nicotinate phosphoribosyltransferase
MERTIIQSILDNDLYKFTMQQAVVKMFPRYKVKYNFINRGGTQFPEGFDVELRKQIKKMEDLALTQDEALYLKMMCDDFMEPTYIDFLKGYRYDSTEVGVYQDGGELNITIHGYWYRTILWEVPLMALISELYFIMTGEVIDSRATRKNVNTEKGVEARENNLKIADFGTRRRYSFSNQAEVVSDLMDGFNSKNWFVGTSNVHLARLHKIKPIGTHAHEWFMFHAAKYGYKMANKIALENWVEVYQGSLGIALSDTFTTEVFFKSFDKKYAKLFDGVRHDSGEPKEFADKVINHYLSLGIDPMSKTIVFSDGLNIEKAIEIRKHCKDRINCSFGIGTNLTNDVGVKPLNMVIKLVSAEIDGDWVGTVKLSDNPGKHTGKDDDIKLAKSTLNLTKKVYQI